jgi:hypothetical protein
MEVDVTLHKWIANLLFAIAVASCLSILGCSGKKGRCSECNNDDQCKSGICATFVATNGDRHLLCADSRSSSETCDIPR